MGALERRFTIPAVLESVEDACEFAANEARAAGLGEDAVYHCHLSVEEVCTNIIEHGYKFQGQDQYIEVVCVSMPDRFTITIIDNATPFDPLARADPDPAAPLAEREGGGWGIFFVKKFMDSIAYKFEANHNQLIMEKRLRGG
ncbi:MAG: ATP-binding protein [bacterium]|nr:ATP-binding protein [bacterium]